MVAQEDTIFTKVINRELPADIVYEDDKCLAFRDIHPVAPVHVLLIPKVVIPKLSDAEVQQQDLLGYLLLQAPKVANILGLDDTFRLVVNNGAGAGQTVFHLHLHIIGGRDVHWPPG